VKIGTGGHLGLFVVRYPGQDLARIFRDWGKRELAVRIVRAHIMLSTPMAPRRRMPMASSSEAEHDVAAQKVGREHAVVEPVNRLAVGLALGVVHRESTHSLTRAAPAVAITVASL
jgi:hypothetical protein